MQTDNAQWKTNDMGHVSGSCGKPTAHPGLTAFQSGVRLKNQDPLFIDLSSRESLSETPEP